MIRPGKEEDAAAYRDLRLEALRNHPEVFSADYEGNAARPMAFWVDRLRLGGIDGTPMMFFADHEGALIGMCGVAWSAAPKVRHSGDIISMYVRPNWRGARVADALITASIGWAQAQGAEIVKLAVVTTNVPAIRCYARCGFHVYGIEPHALFNEGTYYDELLMARRITPIA